MKYRNNSDMEGPIGRRKWKRKTKENIMEVGRMTMALGGQALGIRGFDGER